MPSQQHHIHVDKIAANHLNHWLELHSHLPILFLSSGGSALQILDYLNPDLFTDKITISVLDERFSVDPSINNFAQLASTNFFSLITQRGVQIIDTRPIFQESQTDPANRFESELKNWVQNHPDGKIIATLGIGVDGHTAGILPFPEDPQLFQKLFIDTDHWVVAYDAGAKSIYPLRVTTTFPFLQKLNHAILFVKGLEKAPVLQKAYDKSDNYPEVPGRLIKLLPSVHLFTDLPAPHHTLTQ